MTSSLLLSALTPAMFLTSPGASFYAQRFEDPSAIYLTAEAFGAKGDGAADDTQAIQKAIDAASDRAGNGIVFIPEGRYRVTKAVQIWPGVRVIGYGAKRPTFLLAPQTPGYDKSEKMVVYFAGHRPKEGLFDLSRHGGADFDVDFAGEANPGTFYSAMSNIDIEVGDGNPMAVGVRGRYAQHCYLAHMDFRMGGAFAGIHDTGNFAEDLRFFGGRFGLVTRTPSPGWPFTLMDSFFEGQKEAAIHTSETGLTLIRPSIRRTPSGVVVQQGRTEQLWISDAEFDDITLAALTISRESSPRTQIGGERILCRNTPIFARFRESGRALTGDSPIYQVREFSHGLTFEDDWNLPETKTLFGPTQVPGEKSRSSNPSGSGLPPMDQWTNLRDLGAKGDGESDDTVALQSAIDAHRVVYLPIGKYRVSQTIRLRPDSVLIGLHPYLTQILIKDGTAAFSGYRRPGADESSHHFPGRPIPLLYVPAGSAFVSGIGLDTGGNNPAAIGADWQAGEASVMEDVKFLGGHGSVPWERIYNSNHTADPDPNRKWDSQYPSLWVRNGGGGTFKNIWTASTFAQSGMTVSDTHTRGHVYQLSTEHHVRNEVKVSNSSNWAFYALQAEEERGEGPFCLPLELSNASNILVANLNIYRVISMAQPFPCAIRTVGCTGIKLRNIHCGSNSKASFDNLLADAQTGDEVRQREFARLTVGTRRSKARSKGGVPTLASGARIEKLATGFFNISGGSVDPEGNYAFVDARFHRVYQWDIASRAVRTLLDAPLAPVNVAYDRSGTLLVVSYAGDGVVFAFKPGQPDITILEPTPSTAGGNASFALPVTDWALNQDLRAGHQQAPQFRFLSPDGSLILPVDEGFLKGWTSWGVKDQAVIRSFGLASARPGQKLYICGESDLETYVATVGADGSLEHARLFAEVGGEGVAVDWNGNVYIAAGQIYVYDPNGTRLGCIPTPERPIHLAFGGKDGKTLFIAARTTLYSLQIR